jgi:hypothetical protein
MAKKKGKAAFPDRKISETFMEFAEPLLGTVDGIPTKEQIDTVLKVAFTIWNSVVLDTTNNSPHYVKELRRYLAGHVLPEALVEQMIFRKQTMFGNDLRMIGNYRIVKKNGEWHLWAEARKPPIVQ